LEYLGGSKGKVKGIRWDSSWTFFNDKRVTAWILVAWSAVLVVVFFEQRARNIHHNIYARDIRNVPEVAIRINSPAAAEGGGGGGGGGGAWRTQELAAGRRNAANGSRPAQQARPILRRPAYPEKKGGWEGGGRAGVRNREREREGIAWKEGERGRECR
jgi:hypothetical protein